MTSPMSTVRAADSGAATNSTPSELDDGTERLERPFRLGLVAAGASLGLFSRLAAANSIGDTNSSVFVVLAAATSLLVGCGMLLMAAERDRFSAPLIWITVITAAAWGTLNWISPPFAPATAVWNVTDQRWFAVLGVGNGLVLAGIVVLAFVRRAPTLSVALALIAGACMLASNSLLYHQRWPSIVCAAAAFALLLLAWDRSPRREPTFVAPEESPRVSRAALSFASVALCGTALQLWVSRNDIPDAIPAVLLSVVLIAAAFASLIRVRREI